MQSTKSFRGKDPGSLPDERCIWYIMHQSIGVALALASLRARSFLVPRCSCASRGMPAFLHLAQIDFASFGIHEVSNHGDSSGGVQHAGQGDCNGRS